MLWGVDILRPTESNLETNNISEYINIFHLFYHLNWLRMRTSERLFLYGVQNWIKLNQNLLSNTTWIVDLFIQFV